MCAFLPAVQGGDEAEVSVRALDAAATVDLAGRGARRRRRRGPAPRRRRRADRDRRANGERRGGRARSGAAASARASVGSSRRGQLVEQVGVARNSAVLAGEDRHEVAPGGGVQRRQQVVADPVAEVTGVVIGRIDARAAARMRCTGHGSRPGVGRGSDARAGADPGQTVEARPAEQVEHARSRPGRRRCGPSPRPAAARRGGRRGRGPRGSAPLRRDTQLDRNAAPSRAPTSATTSTRRRSPGAARDRRARR